VQRFDPGFGMNQGPYGIQPMYAPMVNYNTEFPQLGGGIRPQICVEQNVHRAIPPPRPVRGPWSGNPTSMNFTHPDSMMSSFSSGVYMHPQQFARPAPTMMAVNNNQERFPPLLQVGQMPFLKCYLSHCSVGI
jgi:large subunit ribosomal protein L10Ae